MRQPKVGQQRRILRLGADRLLEPGNRLLLTPQPLQRHGQVACRALQIRLQSHRLRQCCDGRLILSGIGQSASVFGKHRRVGRIGLGRGLKHCDCRIEVMLLPVYRCQMDPGLRVLAVFAQGSLKRRARFIPLLHLRMHRSHGVVDLRARPRDPLFRRKLLQRFIPAAHVRQCPSIGVEERGILRRQAQPQRRLKVRNRLRAIAGPPHRYREVSLDCGVRGLQMRRPLEFRNSFRGAVQRKQRGPQRLVSFGNLGRQLHHFCKARAGLFVVAFLRGRIPRSKRCVRLVQSFRIRLGGLRRRQHHPGGRQE